MPAPGRNEPCPCGSGLKYKKCCLSKEEEARARATPPPGTHRLVSHRGRPLAVSGGVDPQILDHALEFFEQKDRGEGPAAQMVRFAQPLLDTAGDNPGEMERAVNLAALFWNLALSPGDERDSFLDGVIEKLTLSGDAEREEFRALAAQMVERHVAMFPELHQRRRPRA